MSKLNRLIGLAKKAIDSQTGSSNQHSSTGAARPTGSGQTDWRSIVRSAADTLTGDGRTNDRQPQQPPQQQNRSAQGLPDRLDAGYPERSARPSARIDPADRAAIARYDYLMQTADPHQIEQVHREAFERLTPGQREQIRARMDDELSPTDRPRSAEAPDLARAAARTEAGRPGFLRGLLARAGGGAGGAGGGRGGRGGAALAGAGIGAAGGLLAGVAGAAIVGSVAGPLLANAANLGVDFDALAGGLDVEGLTGGFDEMASGASDAVSGVGDQVSGFGDQISGLGEGFDLGDLGGFFNR